MRVIGQIEKIECAGNRWFMQVLSGGRQSSLGRRTRASLRWLVYSRLYAGPARMRQRVHVPASAVFTYAKSDMLDGELRAD